jgi:hypothetical protein
MLWSDEGESLSFNWAFIHQSTDGRTQAVDFSRRVRFGGRDLFKIFFQPLENAYIYLYLLDAQGELSLIFPEDLDDFDHRYRLGEKYMIPEGEAWFSLDENRGIERFYLLVSPQRFFLLESLTRSYLKIYNDQRSLRDEINSAKQKVLDQIVALRQENSRFTVVAEKPISIAGGVRGRAEEIEQLATQVTAQGFFSKTLRLEHRH